jgi:hypothetical protein
MKVEYTKRKQEDQEVLRQQDLASLKKIVAEMPAATRKSAKLVVGERSFTPEEMLAEAEKGSEYGATFLKMLSRMRLETLRKG